MRWNMAVLLIQFRTQKAWSQLRVEEHLLNLFFLAQELLDGADYENDPNEELCEIARGWLIN